MRTGRKSTPTTIKKVMNNPGKRLLNEAEPAFNDLDDTQPPDSVVMHPHALAEWQRIAPLLRDRGILTEADYSALVGYCLHYGMREEAALELQASGMVYESTNDKGVTMQRKSPWIEIFNTSSRLMLSFASEFGLTPSSRSKVTIINREEDSSLAEFLQ